MPYGRSASSYEDKTRDSDHLPGEDAVDANVAHVRQSMPDYGLDFQIEVLESVQGVPSMLGGRHITTLEVTQGQILRQSPTDATYSR